MSRRGRPSCKPGRSGTRILPGSSPTKSRSAFGGDQYDREFERHEEGRFDG
jgi:hypothetical protein